MKIYGIDMQGKFLGEKLSTLPAWQASDEGRLVFALDVEKLYVGTGSEWVDLLSETTTAQSLATLPTWASSDEGRMVYVRDEEKFYGGSDATAWICFSGVTPLSSLPEWTSSQEGNIVYDESTGKMYFGGPTGWVGVAQEGRLLEVSSLPSFTSNDEGRMIYAQDVEKVYYGDSTSWVLLSTSSSAGDSMELNVATLGDQSAIGTKSTLTAGENVSFGDICYLKADGKYWKADADSSASMPGKVMAIATILADASGEFLVLGYARDTSWSWTVGNGIANFIYASTTPGAITQTAPSGSGDQVQIIGYAHTSDILLFEPQFGMLER